MTNDGSTKSKDTIKWIKHMDIVFADVLLKEQYKGNKVDCVFTIYYL